MKIWHPFLCSWLLPISYVIEVMKDRAIVLYAIKHELPINVGSIIYTGILYEVNNLTTGFSFSWLLTSLLMAARVDIFHQ